MSASMLDRIEARVRRVARDKGVVPQIVVVPVRDRSRLQREFRAGIRGGYDGVVDLTFIEGARIVWSPLAKQAAVY